MGVIRLNQFGNEVEGEKNDENSSTYANLRSQQARAAPLRHYEVPNLSSMLYEYTNREKDIVERAFRGGNYQTIRALPDEIKPFNVGQAVKQRIAEAALTSSIAGQNNQAFSELLKADGGSFYRFKYQEDYYDAAKELECSLRDAHR